MMNPMISKTCDAILDGKAKMVCGGVEIFPGTPSDLGEVPGVEGDDGEGQPSGIDVLARMIQRISEEGVVEGVGNRIDFPYSEGPEGQGPLRWRLRFQRGGAGFLPAWERDAIETVPGGKGAPPRRDVITKEERGLPYLWHDGLLMIVDAKDGQVDMNDPERPVLVEDRYMGVTDDGRLVAVKLGPSDDHKRLCELGFHVGPEGMAKWREAVKCQRFFAEKSYATYRRGWIRLPGCSSRHYVYGGSVISPSDAPSLTVMSKGGAGMDGVRQRGTFEGWAQAESLALRNPCHAFLAGFAASAALLALVDNMEPGVAHVFGGSGAGKTTLLQTIAALIGSAERPSESSAYVQSWRVTENALEAPLEARNDAPALFDELHGLQAKADVLSLLYMAANGRGKGRMTKEIEERLSKVWKTQILSTGEVTFAERVRMSGAGDMTGGLQFRVVEVNAAEAPFWSDAVEQGVMPGGGVYAGLCSQYPSSSRNPTGRVVEALERAFLENHGHFWPRWIETIQRPGMEDTLRERFDQFRGGLSLPNNASAIFRRRAKHVAAGLTGLSGILDILGIVGSERKLIEERAHQWAKDHFWAAGLSRIEGEEGDDWMEKFQEWLLANEHRLLVEGESYSPNRELAGWVDATGNCALSAGVFKKVCAAELKLDYDRLCGMMEVAGWTKQRLRHPLGGRLSTALTVWTKESVFNAKKA